MGLDLSRDLFDRRRHHRGVVLQQGRLLLDAELNEQADILEHRRRTTTADLVGPSGAAGDGFRVTAGSGTLAVAPGRLYRDGFLCELLAAVPDLGAQPDLPGVALPTANGTYLAYLEAWEREVSAAVDADLLDPAFASQRTAGRHRLVTQVRLQAVPAGAVCSSFAPPWTPDGTPAPAAGTLAASAAAGATTFADQLYRVEVHAPGPAGTATWKWARDGASVELAVLSVAGTTLNVAPRPGLAPGTALAAGDRVEVTDDGRALRGEPGVLATLAAVDLAAGTLTVAAWPGGAPVLGSGAVARKWEGDAQPLNAGATVVVDGVLALRFAAGGRPFRSGEHWLVPTRRAAGVLWPQLAGTAEPLPPRGPERHFAALALVQRAAGSWTVASDCRVPLRPLTDTLDPNKVDRGGDSMTGPLTVTEDLMVVAQMHAGGTTLPPAGTQLQVSGGPLEVASGASPAAGLRFVVGAGEAALRLTAAGFVFEAATGGSLVFREGAADRLVLAASGNLGLGVASPTASLQTGGQARATALTVSGAAPNGVLTFEPGAIDGYVLTSDADGKATWQQLPSAASGSPVYFPDLVVVANGSTPSGYQTFTFSDGDVPEGASAVLVQAQTFVHHGSVDIRIRRNAGAAEVSLLRAHSFDGGPLVGKRVQGGAANQGIFPLDNGSFQWAVVEEFGPLSLAWEIRAVGFFL